MTLDADKLTDKQALLVSRAFAFPAILRTHGEKITAASLERNGWGNVESGAGLERIFRLNQDGENEFEAAAQSWRAFNKYKTPAPHFPSSSYASGTNQGCTAAVTSDGGTTGSFPRRESASMAVGADVKPSPQHPEIFDHGNSPDSLQWLARVKAWGWPFNHFDDPREVKP